MTNKKSKQKSKKSKKYYERIIKKHNDRILWLQPQRIGPNGVDADMEIYYIKNKIEKLKSRMRKL